MKWDRMMAGPGERDEIESMYFKPYPCCRHYRSIVDGICALRAEARVRTRRAVKHIHIGLYASGVNGHDHKHADNLLDAQMSAPVAAALAVVDGILAAHHFLPESVERPEVQRLVDSVTPCSTKNATASLRDAGQATFESISGMGRVSSSACWIRRAKA